MLFDDVTSALDPEVIGEVLGIIRLLATEHSLTIVMVIHQMGFAREISDRVCFFYEGKSVEQDDPDPGKFFEDPENERTRQFLIAVLNAD
jgi:polar amino acid transport system ATP-binding protein